MAPLLRRAVPALAAVAVLVALVFKLGAAPVLAGLRALTPEAIAIALLLGVVGTAAAAGRWCLVARGMGLRLSWRGAVADCYRAQLLNAVLPAGVLGDVHRAVDHGHRNGDLARGVRAVVLERVAGQLVLVAGAAGLLAVTPRLLPVLADAVVPSGFAGTVVGAAVCGAVVGVAIGFRDRLGALLSGLAADVRAIGASRAWPGVVLASTVALASYLATFVLAARVAGAVAPVGELLPVLALALLVMGLPVNVGGFGPREAVTAVAFTALGLSAATGLATSVVYGVLTMVAASPGLLVLVLRRTVVRVVLDRPASPARMAPAHPTAPDHQDEPREAGWVHDRTLGSRRAGSDRGEGDRRPAAGAGHRAGSRRVPELV